MILSACYAGAGCFLVHFICITLITMFLTCYAGLGNTGELGYDRALCDGLMRMTDDMLGTSPMH